MSFEVVEERVISFEKEVPQIIPVWIHANGAELPKHFLPELTRKQITTVHDAGPVLRLLGFARARMLFQNRRTLAMMGVPLTVLNQREKDVFQTSEIRAVFGTNSFQLFA